jgi:hypothetical protein
MPTPASGAISMNDLNVEVLRAGGTATVAMSTIRARYGGSGSISFSDLRKAEGFTLNPANITISGKFAQNSDGWQDDSVGSISPDENSGRLQFAANSFLFSILEDNLGSPGTTRLQIGQDTAVIYPSGDQVTDGFRTSNITRLVLANTSYGVTAASNSTFSYADVSYNMPTSGTIHCLIKF